MATGFAVDHDRGRDSFLAELTTLTEVLDQLSEAELWAASRCRGWAVSDVAVHVHLGLQEMVLGVLSPTSALATADAASYWSAYQPPEDPGDLHHLHFVRLLASAYRRPDQLLTHWQSTASALARGVQALPSGPLDFQGRVLATGDFLATWAVELAVHHLDLGRELDLAPPEPTALRLARETVEALAGPMPADWSDEEVVLLGTGRTPVDDAVRAELGERSERLPVFG